MYTQGSLVNVPKYMTKQTGEFVAPNLSKGIFGGINAMKIFLVIDETPPASERSFEAATKLRCELVAIVQSTGLHLKVLNQVGGYSCIYDLVASAICSHIIELTFLWQYRAILNIFIYTNYKIC